MNSLTRIAALTLSTAGLLLGLSSPASAQGSLDAALARTRSMQATATPVQSANMTQVAENPGQLSISGCFLRTAPLYVTSGVDTVKVWDVSVPEHPRLVGTLVDALFENEAMNCGERRTDRGIERFALIGVDSVQASPDDPEHVNAGGNELIVVDVTDPTDPTIRSRTPATTSTHTVACVDETRCTTAYSAGDRRTGFSVLDLRDLDAPSEVDGDASQAGVQPFASPTAGHKWNFDDAGYGTHTGWYGASMWDTTTPLQPRLVTTTGAAGRGEDPAHPGWNDFILHNAYRPNADAFEPESEPSLAHGNVLLVTEEDYEQTDCAQAGSFQTWWVKRLDGTPDAIVPLDKVELADLGTYPLPQGAFCSSHWFDFHPDGLVAAGFYGGGTQILDVRDPRDIKPYAHSVWGGSEVWDAMWVPVYRDGRMTSERTDVVYAIDLVRGLDVYRVDLPGSSGAATSQSSWERAPKQALTTDAAFLPVGLVGGALLLSGALRRRRARQG